MAAVSPQISHWAGGESLYTSMQVIASGNGGKTVEVRLSEYLRMEESSRSIKLVGQEKTRKR